MEIPSSPGGPTPLQKIIESRRSIRRFLPTPIGRDLVRTCLEAARLAPSAHNVQPWRFIVIDDPDLKEKFAAAAFSGLYSGSKFAARAPVLIVLLMRLDVLTHRVAAGLQKIPYHFLDMGIAGEHIVLQAEELGLATCWMGWFHRGRARKALGLSRRYKIVAVMPLGYAEKRPLNRPPRKTFEQIVSFNEVPRE